MKYEIRSRWDNQVLYTAEIGEDEPNRLRAAVEAAVRSSVSLRNANLEGADLGNAYLRGAYLRNANLRNANLRGATLYGATLYGATLYGATLYGATLEGAYLEGATLEGADLRCANIRVIRDDFFAMLDAAPMEAPDLLAALCEGRVNGSLYEGECACLVGTIANARGCSYNSLGDLRPDARRPAETFALSIQQGDTPENHPIVAHFAEWTEQWMGQYASGKRPAPVAREGVSR